MAPRSDCWRGPPSAHVISPDGRTLYNRRGSEPDVAVIARDLTTGVERRLRTLDRTVMELRLSRDGRMLGIVMLSAVELIDLTTGRVLLHRAAPEGAKFVVETGVVTPGPSSRL